MYVYICISRILGTGSKRALHPPKLGLQMVGGHQVGVGNKNLGPLQKHLALLATEHLSGSTVPNHLLAPPHCVCMEGDVHTVCLRGRGVTYSS